MKISIFLDFLTIKMLIILGIYLIVFKTNFKDELIYQMIHPINFLYSIINDS